MDAAFFKRLYQGYAAEHYVSSQLFRRAFEVFRLPADFGLDLVVTNQFRVTQKLSEDAASFPFALQVKSRWLKKEDIIAGPNNRPEAIFTYSLTAKEVSVLLEHQNSAVVFVFYWPLGNLTFHPSCFWIYSKNLPALVKLGYFREQKDGYLFTVRYRKLPEYTSKTFVEELSNAVKLSGELKNYLLKNLPGIFLRNWKASDYLSFARAARDGTTNLVFKSPWPIQTDFSTFPAYEKISGLD